jgi:hypothetical protein
LGVPERLPPWTRWLVYRHERTRTTWTLRLGLLVVVALTISLSERWWAARIGRSLVCEQHRERSDALLVENFDTEYFLFEQARALRADGVSKRVLIPVRIDATTGRPDEVAEAVTDVIARIAHLGSYETVPVRESEPVALNVARDVLTFARREHIASLTVVAPVFRSRRSALVYQAVFDSADIAVRCVAARGPHSPVDWTSSWHGVQNVFEQTVKLAYYRAYVLPVLAD